MIQYELNPTINRTLLSGCRFASTYLFMFIPKLITNSEAPCKFLKGSNHMFQPYFANLSQVFKDLLNIAYFNINKLFHFGAPLFESTFCFTFSACSKWICLIVVSSSSCFVTSHTQI